MDLFGTHLGLFKPLNIHISFVFLIALSHIPVSAAYRSRIYENFDTQTSEPYFGRATYAPHTCDVTVTFPWRISDVSVFIYCISLSYMYVRRLKAFYATYV